MKKRPKHHKCQIEVLQLLIVKSARKLFTLPNLTSTNNKNQKIHTPKLLIKTEFADLFK